MLIFNEFKVQTRVIIEAECLNNNKILFLWIQWNLDLWSNPFTIIYAKKWYKKTIYNINKNIFRPGKLQNCNLDLWSYIFTIIDAKIGERGTIYDN